jgi:DNA invertase Pin-like site-specific DNA recombinase/AraC-like DNA-binding protein
VSQVHSFEIKEIPYSARAAQYIRMSTDHQRYSCENQASAIAAYAEGRGFRIVQTYTDEGRSGLGIVGRDALRQLIADVRSGQASFSVILVYDVSRWGRFQDADEAAYHEYFCKAAGVKVLYCQEPFENDGSMLSTLVKNMKRAMAGEYSRELSVKVFAAHCRLAPLGFRQGGSPGYAFRRVLLDETGSPKLILTRGQRKNLQTERVILRPGSESEIETVRRIFRSFVVERKTQARIAHELNLDEIPNELGRPWRRSGILGVLTNEKYIGNNVYNRTTSKLNQKNTKNPARDWIRATAVFDAIVEPSLFVAANEIVDQRRTQTMRHVGMSNNELLRRLRRLLGERFYLSGQMIDAATFLPHSALYCERFGSLEHAYQLIGYSRPSSFQSNKGKRAVVKTIAEVIASLAPKFRDISISAIFDKRARILKVGTTLRVLLVVARSCRLPVGTLSWKIGRRAVALDSDLIMITRMEEGNQSILDHYLLPTGSMPDGNISLSANKRTALSCNRLENLDQVAELLARSAARLSA